MATLKEKRIMKTLVIDYEESSITVTHLDQVTRDDQLIAASPIRQIYTAADYDKLKSDYPNSFAKFAQSELGWSVEKAKKARAARGPSEEFGNPSHPDGFAVAEPTPRKRAAAKKPAAKKPAAKKGARK